MVFINLFLLYNHVDIQFTQADRVQIVAVCMYMFVQVHVQIHVCVCVYVRY